VFEAPPSSPPEPSASSSYDAPLPELTQAPDVPREPAPERDFAPPRAEPVEADFARGAPEGIDAREPRSEQSQPTVAASESWTPPERSFDERPAQGASERAEPAGSGESVAVSADERQAG
jgi:hypothetical protein